MSNWSRRTFLVTVGTAAVAGCVTGSDAPTGDTEAETTSGSAPESARSTTPTDTVPPDATASETRTETETETETKTETQSPATPEPPVEPPSTLDSEWPMPRADSGQSNYNPAASGPTSLVDELWTVETETDLSGPVVAGETLFVGGDDGAVRAFDARTGDRRWQRSVGDTAGPPRVFDGRLFVPTEDAVVALSAGDGSESWRTTTPGRPGRQTAPDGVVWHQGIVVAAHGVYWFDNADLAVVGLARDDGSERWRTAVDDPAESPLFAAEDYVFLSSGTHDNRFWIFHPETGKIRGKEPRGGADFPAEQCYLGGTMYAVDGFFGNVRASVVTGAGPSWYQGVPPAGGGAGHLVGGDQRVYYTSNTTDEPDLFALSRSDGRVEWKVDVEGAVVGRPTVASETVLLPTENGLRCYDPADGAERWATGRDVRDPAVVDDLLYTTADGVVRAFRPR